MAKKKQKKIPKRRLKQKCMCCRKRTSAKGVSSSEIFCKDCKYEIFAETDPKVREEFEDLFPDLCYATQRPNY
jgi:hypothetical protein